MNKLKLNKKKRKGEGFLELFMIYEPMPFNLNFEHSVQTKLA